MLSFCVNIYVGKPARMWGGSVGHNTPPADETEQ